MKIYYNSEGVIFETTGTTRKIVGYSPPLTFTENTPIHTQHTEDEVLELGGYIYTTTGLEYGYTMISGKTLGMFPNGVPSGWVQSANAVPVIANGVQFTDYCSKVWNNNIEDKVIFGSRVCYIKPSGWIPWSHTPICQLVPTDCISVWNTGLGEISYSQPYYQDIDIIGTLTSEQISYYGAV